MLEDFLHLARDDLVSFVKARCNGRSTVIYIEGGFYHTLVHAGIVDFVLSSKLNVFACTELTPNTTSYAAAEHVIYIARPDSETLRTLVMHVCGYAEQHPESTPHMLFAPQKTLLIDHILKSELLLSDYLGSLHTDSIELDLVPLIPSEVFSMQQPHIFKQLFCLGDTASLRWMARVLVKMQTSQLGVFPHVYAKGGRAVQVVRMMEQMLVEVGTDFADSIVPEIDNLLVIDRTVDLATPLVTQLTYEGVMDELYEIDCKRVRLPFALQEGAGGTASTSVGAPAAERTTTATTTMLVLSESDKIFAELRDKNFTTIGSVLFQKSVQIKQSYERRREVKQIRELKEFVKELPEVQELQRLVSTHTTIATAIGKIVQSQDFRQRIEVEHFILQQVNEREVFDYVEELIYTQADLISVLRLLCLYSVVNRGLATKDYDAFRDALMLAYGIPHILATLFALERCRLLIRRDDKPAVPYASIRRQLRTWSTSLDEQKPDDAAYAYSGYTSLLVRLIQSFIASPRTWNDANTVVDSLTSEKLTLHKDVRLGGPPSSTVIFVIGGVTSAELSSLRFIKSKLANEGKAVQLMVCSTDVCSGKRLMRSMLPFDVESRPK